MLPSDRKVFEAWRRTHLERQRATRDLIAEQLLRSYQQLDKSRALLSIETPNIWRPEQPVITTSPSLGSSPDVSCSSP